MLETEALVVKSEHGLTWVQPQSGGCGGKQCSTQGCGTAMLTQLFTQQPRLFKVNNPIAAQPGERVMVGMQEKAFLRSALLVYLLPLASLLIGAILASTMTADASSRDLHAGLGALSGLAFALIALKIRTLSTTSSSASPTILRRL